jgi:hypothetical protein
MVIVGFNLATPESFLHEVDMVEVDKKREEILLFSSQ